MSSNIFTLKEVQAILKMSELVVRKLVNAQKIEHFKINGRIRISEEHLDRFLESTRIPVKTQMAQNS
ncbi:MAG: helix-turn-helix domain-containing protein [Sulfurimonas sp.]|nr:helix-turn-helix domain-containing protein [Sulfurimonas sp.]